MNAVKEAKMRALVHYVRWIGRDYLPDLAPRICISDSELRRVLCKALDVDKREFEALCQGLYDSGEVRILSDAGMVWLVVKAND